MITDESSVTMTAHEGQDAPQIKLKGEQGLQDVPPPPTEVLLHSTQARQSASVEAPPSPV